MNNNHQIFQTVSTSVLSQILNGGDDILDLVKREMAYRGVDANGEWIGFDKAAELFGISKSKKASSVSNGAASTTTTEDEEEKRRKRNEASKKSREKKKALLAAQEAEQNSEAVITDETEQAEEQAQDAETNSETNEEQADENAAEVNEPTAQTSRRGRPRREPIIANLD